jgi:hypothetical protein
MKRNVNLKEKRVAKIKLRRFKAEDIKRLAKIIQLEYLNASTLHDEKIKNGSIPKRTPEPRIVFKVTTIEDFEYTLEPFEFENVEQILNTKIIKTFSLSFASFENNSNIEVAVTDSQYGNTPRTIQVEGTDSTWVNGMFNRLVESINLCEKQSIIPKFRWPIAFVMTILGAYGLGWLITIPLPKLTAAGKPNDLTQSIFAFIYLISFFVFLPLLGIYLKKLWPDIEIVPLLTHERKLEKWRKSLYFVATIIIIPFIISIVANIFFK